MNFVSAQFVLFFILTLILFLWLPARWRFWMLLAVSYYFYGTWSIPFIGVILLSTSMDYWMSHIIARNDSQKVKKLALVGGLTFNLLVLGFFKYFNFMLGTAHGAANFFGYQLALPESLHILLPLGISFYTFEAISYLVDVYRGQAPSKSWMEYNFYIMYFPHLISGPIIRFHELADQYKAPIQLPTMERFAKGTELILLGYIFKVLIADNAAAVVDPIFDDPDSHSAFMNYLAAIAFTVQIYFDFMGYTHIARGASLYFNIELPLNFNHPYNATNISDFWGRWHISLSRWIRDYLYIPLGGSRCSLGRTATNLIVTMLIAGAWHGAGWTYIAWGGFHGVLLAIYHFYKTKREQWFGVEKVKALLQNPVYHLGTMALTFALVVIGWVFFRAPNFQVAIDVLDHMIRFNSLGENVTTMLATGDVIPLVQMAVLLALCFTGPKAVQVMEGLYRPLPFWAKVQVACVVAIACWIWTANGVAPFIYFQF